MDGPFVTGISIYFDAPELPCDVLARIAASVEQAASSVEREEIDFLDQQLPEYSGILDAVRYRVKKYQGSAVVLEGSTHGSIILTGVLVGLAYWLLDNTLGETFKESWTRSSRHSHLVELLSRRRQVRGQKLAEKLETDASLRQGTWPLQVHVSVFEEIDVHVHLVRSEVPGTYRSFSPPKTQLAPTAGVPSVGAAPAGGTATAAPAVADAPAEADRVPRSKGAHDES
jgi:hypothetical protein